MDYDDNDFESQNLHLVVEGNTKFPPVLSPYALPKFDFDESLQANLRFDNLIETEVFLGIESNEDNQWIDAFSRGGSNVEFSSTTAGSCSISRYSNVWSEATSSESVEMLLKSVGQGDYIPRQTVIQGSDACNELDCLAKKMDSNPKPDDRNEFKDNVTDLQPTCGTPTSFSGLKMQVGMEQSQTSISHGHGGEFSIDGSSGILEPNDMFQNMDLPMSEGSPSLFTNDESNIINQREVQTVANASDHGETHDPSTLMMETNITESSVQHMVDEQQGSQQTQTNNQNLEDSTTKEEAVVDTQCLDQNEVSGDASNADKSLILVPPQDSLEGGSVVKGPETGLSSLECSTGMETIVVSDNTSENVVLLEDAAMNDQSVPDACISQKVPAGVDSVSAGQMIYDSNSSRGIYPNLQPTVDVIEKKTYSMSNICKENTSLNTGGNNENRVDNFSGFSLVASSINSSVVAESTQICVINEPDRQSDVETFDQDVSVNDEENTKIHSDSSQMHYDVAQSHVGDKGAVSSSLSAGSMESEFATSTVSIDNNPIHNPENISLKSCEITNNQPPSEVLSHDGATGDNDIRRVTTVESSSFKGKEKIAMKITEEVGISTLVGSSEQEIPPCPVKETEKHLSGTSEHFICDTASDSMHDVGTCGAAKIEEPQREIDEKVSQECIKEISMPPVLRESSEKQGDGVTISVIKEDEETLQEIHDKSSSKEPDDILLGNKDSISSAPFPVSCGELSETGSFPAPSAICSPSSSTFRSPFQTEKDENQGKVSANQTPPASDLKNCGTHNTSKDERSSTPGEHFVDDLSKEDIADLDTDVGKRQPAPVIATNNASIALEKSLSISGLGPSKTKTVANVSHGSPQISDGEVAVSAAKATPKRKARQPSNKAAGKESAKRGGRAKNASPAIQSEAGYKSTKVTLSPSPGFKLMQSNEVQQYGHIDSNSAKAFSLANTSTSSLPNLNTSASPSVLFHQPFTDMQQVQLRAQILVYGALMQGTTPDEAHMISAYGGTDGGRNVWENVWRVCLERQRCKKSYPITPETPLPPRSVARTSDSTVKQNALQGKGISSSSGRASSKTTPTISNPLIPLSSPLWSLPTLSCDSLQSSALARGSVVDYSQTLTPLHPYLSPPPRNFIGHNTSWISQTSLRGPWVGSPTPPPDNSTHIAASPATDAIKLDSVKGSSLPPSSNIKNASLGPPASSAVLQSNLVETAQPDVNDVTVSPAQHSTDPKSKKRKKAGPSTDFSQKPLQSLTPPVGSRASNLDAVVIPVGNVPISSVEKSVVSVSPLGLADQPKNDQTIEKRILSDESLIKVKEARVHAEEASAHSTAAVNHCLELWNQLDKHKNSGLMSDIEATLASAAVAVAAAATVAKAAAAAANVASNAAFQAKLMADEALISSGYENSRLSNKVFLSEGTSDIDQATPASILKGASGPTSRGSIFFAAKEAIRKRVDAASVATKRVENMDAILKAAELAAEAVSHAGKIVTMGDPLPLIELIEAGPEGCWKASRDSSQEEGLLKDIARDLLNINVVRDIPESRDISSSGISASIMINENNSRQKALNASDLIKPVDMVLGYESEKHDSFTVRNESKNLEENNLKEGSLVEVFKDEEGYKAAWFIANILSLKDGKAYVCYTSLVAVEGPLKEWVSLECEGDKPPRIRHARPLTSLQHEGTRKRRRSAMGDYAWSVGDRVDAWIEESWREGVITEKNKKDVTTLTVHIPASGETSVLRAWHLRPSLIWKDGKWLEFSKVGANDSSIHEGDTPHEKRPKLGSNAVEVKGKNKMSESIDAADSENPDEMHLLNLTESEKVFNVGKSSKNESKQDAHRLVRSGLQKEGSKVIFGVPKPGRKRKFMDVSKHYVSHGSSKANDKNDSVQIANFSMSHGSGLQSWRNSSKNDTKEKLGADSKPKAKFGKPQGILGRVNPPRNASVSNALSLTTDLTGHTEMTKDSSKHSKNTSQSDSQVPVVFSAPASSTDTLSTKRTFTSRASKGKLAPASDKLRKGGGTKASNLKDKPTKSTSESDVLEPRRSNRRIQPTSRLLEGLQSSLIVSKIPSVSHNRNIPKGNNHQG